MQKCVDCEKAIRIIAKREGVTVEEARRELELAMLEGLNNQDPVIQARWKMIPCSGTIPTSEELIAYIALHINSGTHPFKR